MPSRNSANARLRLGTEANAGPAPVPLRVSICEEDKRLDGATPNVITEDGLRDLLSKGYLIEVSCKQTAEKRHNSWYGSWVVYAVAVDGQDAKMLVTSRSVFKLRVFKTIVGLVSFLADMGCLSANIPLIAGRRERHEASGSPATATS